MLRVRLLGQCEPLKLGAERLLVKTKLFFSEHYQRAKQALIDAELPSYERDKYGAVVRRCRLDPAVHSPNTALPAATKMVSF
jgi:hypothetical protein